MAETGLWFQDIHILAQMLHVILRTSSDHHLGAPLMGEGLRRRVIRPMNIYSQKKAGGMERTAVEFSDYLMERDAPDSLKQLAKDHWAKYRPKMYQRLLTTGVLEDLLERAVEFTREDMRQLEKQLRQQGYDEGEAHEQAWQELRAKWIFLPREK
jgi:hypothetical protein